MLQVYMFFFFNDTATTEIYTLSLQRRSSDLSEVRVTRVSDLPAPVSATFDPTRWRTVTGFEDLTDLTYHRGVERQGVEGHNVERHGVERHGVERHEPGGQPRPRERDLPVVRIAFDRPEVRNAFRPHTVDELYRVLDHARMTSDVGTVLLTGNGPSPKDGVWSFCSGGDQRIRGRDGYRYTDTTDAHTADAIDPARAGRLHILEVQRDRKSTRLNSSHANISYA